MPSPSTLTTSGTNLSRYATTSAGSVGCGSGVGLGRCGYVAVGASVDVGVGGTGVLVGVTLGTTVGVAVDVGSDVGEEAGRLVSPGRGLDVAVAVDVGVCRTRGADGVLAGGLAVPWSN